LFPLCVTVQSVRCVWWCATLLRRCVPNSQDSIHSFCSRCRNQVTRAWNLHTHPSTRQASPGEANTMHDVDKDVQLLSPRPQLALGRGSCKHSSGSTLVVFPCLFHIICIVLRCRGNHNNQSFVGAHVYHLPGPQTPNLKPSSTTNTSAKLELCATVDRALQLQLALKWIFIRPASINN
jgi:hypothetical protein